VLVDEAKEVGAGGIDTAQRFQRLFRAEARRVGDHHLGQADDGIEGNLSSWLMLARNCDLRSLASASWRLLSWISSKQPHVLDRDRRLVGKRRYQLDLLLGERPYLGAS